MTQLYEIKVSLSPNQKKNLSNAYHKRETIVLRLTKDSLSGNDTLYVPSNVVKRLAKSQKLKKGMDIKLAKTNIRKQVGGSLLTSILSLGRTLAPTLGKTLGLSALAGLASEGASQIVKKISGNGIQSGGFLIPQNKINQLIAYKHLLTNKHQIKPFLKKKLEAADHRRQQLKGHKSQISQAYNKGKIGEAEKTLEYKRIDNARAVLNQYIEHYKNKVKMMKGSGLKKRGGNVVFFNDVKQLLKKLELIVGEILAGNTSIEMRNTGVAILDMLLKTSKINKAQHEKLYKTYFKI